MNAKNFALFLTVLAMLLASCQPTAPAQVMEKPQEVLKTVVVERQAESASRPEVVSPSVMPTSASPYSSAGEARPPYEQLPGPQPMPGNNTFEDYGVNPYIDAYEDHLSTFALDVDTASYTVARRYVVDGNLPPSDAVRVEEFVNYFDLGYPTPEDIAFGIYADGAPSPFHYDETYILRFGIQGYRVPEWQRKPASLTFVIDVSGSMNMENRLELVKRSLQLLVDRLRPEDSVAIVVYGSTARIALQPVSGQEREAILEAIYSLRPEGATNAEAGLRLGYQLAMQAYRPGATNRVILCSDGVANVGQTGPDAILDEIRGYVQEGITLTTVGFGMGNFNDVLMEQLADNGNGHYAYVDTLDEARKLFVEDLTSTLEVIALDAKVQVDFNPDVVAYYRLLGYENRDIADQDFRDDSVDAGEIGAGHSVTALYAVYLKEGAEGRIATVQMRWKDPATYQVREINGNFNTWDLEASIEQTSPHYRLAVMAAFYAEVLRESPWVKGLSLSDIYYRAANLKEEIPWDAEVAEFIELLTRASRLQAWGQ
ncbi:MAG TPA: von Willebrand factor type A domain-containing protein [Anaerolineales bacterium]|nr:von Willebrand factor type A domain-containing protein [Anaerolineales bacterium]